MNYQRINQALEYAAEMHHGKMYEYNSDKFQIAHIFFAGAVLIKFGFDDDIVIAGILHDVVEDTEATIEDVEKKFGEKVGKLVEAETVDQNIEWEKRQYLMQDNLRDAPPEVKAIKTADLLHHLSLFSNEAYKEGNATYIKEKGPEKAYWKYEQLLKAIGTGWSHPMLDDANLLLKKMKEKYL
ncbi:MAG: HD domain-containing protein [bacterium]|nr:HD domain-containing protein [bacterium]